MSFETIDDAELRDAERKASGFYNPWAEYHAPGFPLDVLPATMRAFVEAKALETGACVSACAMAALTIASAAITHEALLYLKPGNNFGVSPRLWTLLVAAPSGKKTPVQNACLSPLNKRQTSNYAAWKGRKALAEKAEEPFDEAPPPQLVANDTTPEKLGDILSHQNRGILISHDEMSGFFGAFDRYAPGKGGASDRAFHLKCYDGGPYNIQRMARETIPIANLSTSMLGGIQPGRMRQLKDLSSDGLLQRFIPVMMSPAKMDSDQFDIEARKAWEEFIAWLLSIERFSTDLSSEARKVRDTIRNFLFDGSQIDSEGEAFQSFVGKLDGVWGNLCLLLHVVWGVPVAQPISAGTAAMASTLIKEFIVPHGLAFYRSIAGNAQEGHRAIGAFLAKFEDGRILTRDFSRGPRCLRGLTIEEVQNQISPFVAGGWLEPETPGPYCNAWTVNPAVRGAFQREAEKHTAWVKNIQAKIQGVDE